MSAHGPCAGEHTCAEYAALETWRDEAIAVLVAIRKDADVIRRTAFRSETIPEPPNFDAVGRGTHVSSGDIYDDMAEARLLGANILHQIAKVIP